MDIWMALERFGFPIVVALILLLKFDRRQGRIEFHLARIDLYLEQLVRREAGVGPGDPTPRPGELNRKDHK